MGSSCRIVLQQFSKASYAHASRTHPRQVAHVDTVPEMLVLFAHSATTKLGDESICGPAAASAPVRPGATLVFAAGT